MRESACAGADLDQFFGETGTDSGGVIAEWCDGCPVRVECLQFVLDRRITCGIFGGQTAAERKKWRAAA